MIHAESILATIRNPTDADGAFLPIQSKAEQTPPISKTVFLDLYRDVVMKDFPPTEFIAEGLLPVGYTMYGGKPKKGKSTSVFGSVLIPICLGLPAFGIHKTKQSSVLFCAYEDPERRLKERVNRFVSHDIPLQSLENKMLVCPKLPRFHENGIDEIVKCLDERPDIKVVCIDTLGRFSPPKASGQNDYQHEYEYNGALHTLAHDRQIAIISIVHTTKTAYEDPFDTIRGTGSTSAGDTLMVFEAIGEKRVLHITSRDMGEARYLLQADENQLYRNMGECSDEEYQSMKQARSNGRPSKLTPEAKATIEKLKEEGKSLSQIKGQIEAEYGVTIDRSNISRIKKDTRIKMYYDDNEDEEMDLSAIGE